MTGGRLERGCRLSSVPSGPVRHRPTVAGRYCIDRPLPHRRSQLFKRIECLLGPAAAVGGPPMHRSSQRGSRRPAQQGDRPRPALPRARPRGRRLYSEVPRRVVVRINLFQRNSLTSGSRRGVDDDPRRSRYRVSPSDGIQDPSQPVGLPGQRVVARKDLDADRRLDGDRPPSLLRSVPPVIRALCASTEEQLAVI